MDQTPRFDSLFLLGILKKYLKQLAIIAIASITVSVIFSSPVFITPMFTSTAIVYPQNLIPYSTESPTEQMLQLFESNDIRDALIEDFDLFVHYEIDTTQKFPLTQLHNQMRENINIDKTKFESVEINVKDRDPDIASQMVDSIISKFTVKARTLQREKSAEVVVIFRDQLDFWAGQVDSMEAVFDSIRMNYGILDFEEQMNSFTRVYYTAMKEGRAGNGKYPIDNVMYNMQQKGSVAMSLKDNISSARETYNEVKIKYEDALKDLTKILTYTNIITSPVPAERKSYPVRSLLVIIFTGSVMLFSLVLFIVVENHKRLKSMAA